MIDPHQPLYDACKAYENLIVDENSKMYMSSSLNQQIGGVFSYSDITKALAVFNWIHDDLWGYPDSIQDDDYHIRKAEFTETGVITEAMLDFSSFGEAPYNFYELRDEFIKASIKKNTQSGNYGIRQKTSDILITESVYSLEQCLELDIELTNFIGGVEVPIADFEKEFSEGVKYSEKFPEGNMSVKSIDGTKYLIRCCEPNVGNPTGAWGNATWETVKKFNTDHGLPLINSQFQTRLDSIDYKEVVEVV